MYYIEETEKEFIKYEVTIDKEKLEKLKAKIIENCDLIKHYSYDSTILPDISDKLHIRNYKATSIGWIEGRQELPDRENYHFEYDEYQDTKLVDYINQLLIGNASVFSKLKTYHGSVASSEQTELNLKEKLRVLGEEISTSIYNLSIKKLKILVDLIEKDYEMFQLNTNQKSDEEYVEEIISCIKLTVVKRISKDIIEQVENFYEGTNQKIKKRG